MSRTRRWGWRAITLLAGLVAASFVLHAPTRTVSLSLLGSQFFGARASPSKHRARMLVAITSCNNHALVDTMLNTSARPDFVDYVILDDNSQDDIAGVAARHRVRLVRAAQPRGLTHAWNVAYRLFLDEGYEHLVISNNDVRVPVGAYEALRTALREERFDVLGPLSTGAGLGARRIEGKKGRSEHYYASQLVWTQYAGKVAKSLLEHYVPPSSGQEIQDAIAQAGAYADAPPTTRPVVRHLLGFFLAFTRRAERFQLPDGGLIPSTPYYLIVHQVGGVRTCAWWHDIYVSGRRY